MSMCQPSAVYSLVHEAITHIVPLFIIVMAIRTKTKLLTNYYCYVSEKYEIRFKFQP